MFWEALTILSNVVSKKPNANNNRLEKLNGIFRERVKVQRDWRNHKSAIAEGQRIYYYFVELHEVLEGKTPAEQIGIKRNDKGKDSSK